MKQPPGLQLLHCLESSSQGGDSLFVDAFSAAEQIRRRDSLSFNILSRFPITFQYLTLGRAYFDTKPILEHVPYNPVSHIFAVNLKKLQNTSNQRSGTRTQCDRYANVNWSPMFQAPFGVDLRQWRTADGDSLKAFTKAAAFFRNVTKHSNNLFEYALKPGECVMFDNRRVLHGRKGYTGSRWLKGAYLDKDDFHARWRALHQPPLGTLKGSRALPEETDTQHEHVVSPEL